MTKIKNQVAYVVKTPLALSDYAIGTNSENLGLGMAVGQSISMQLGNLRDLFLAGLSPDTGGTLKITEIEIATLDTDVATTVNAMTPAYTIERYELVFFNIDGQIFLCKSVDVAIGDGETALTNDDFIEFPVSVGPTGNTGVGIESIELTSTSGLVDTYTITFTNADTQLFTVTNGANGADGSVWRNGSGAPSNSLGVNGDYYLNTANGDVYLKATGTYTIVTNIKGANGTNGTNGTFVNVQDLTKTTSFVLQSTDNAKTFFVENGASDITVTVPSGLPSAFFCSVVRKGTGNITFVTSGTTINNPTGLKIDQRYDVAVIEQEGSTNVFDLFGNTKT